MDRLMGRRQAGQLALGGGAALALAAYPWSAAAVDNLPPIWYFGEGSTGQAPSQGGAIPYSGFDQFLTIANPDGGTLQLSVIYYAPNLQNVSGGARREALFSTSSRRYTVVVHDPYHAVNNPAGLNRGFYAHATKVQCLTAGRGIVVERPMYFKYQNRIDGGFVVLGATQPATEWYFAEGWTGDGFDMYLCIFNPNENPPGQRAQATITYYRSGQPSIVRQLDLNSWSRETVKVHDPQQGVGRNQAVAVKITSPVPIVAERSMYFEYYGSMGRVTGGHAVIGSNQPRTTWYFAEGYTGPNYDEFLTIQNPNGAGTANITYYRDQEPPVSRSVPLPANSRVTVRVHDPQSPDNPGGLGRPPVSGLGHSTKVTTTVPTVVERPMYFVHGNGYDGGHVVMGAAQPQRVWFFGEGYASATFDQFFTIANPNSNATTIRITYLVGTGQVVREFTAPANSRTTVAVHDESLGLGRGINGSGVANSARVESLDGNVPIVVERPMYFRYTSSESSVYSGPWTATGGHVTFGHPLS